MERKYTMIPVSIEFSFTIGDLNFKALRKLQDKTLRQVEEATGVSNAYLSQLETGKIRNPSFTVVDKLLSFYGF